MFEGAKSKVAQPARALKIGVMLPHWTGAADGKTANWTDLCAFARQAEAMGFASLWVGDELFWKIAPGETMASWECLSLLSALAATTSRIAIGSMVLSAGYRNPALLAQIACTIDEISKGRFILGIGTGNVEQIHRDYGFVWDHRYSRFEEVLQILHQLFQTGHVDFAGKFYQIHDVEVPMRGPRRAGPPILIGTEAPGPRMLQFIAKYADQWNCWVVGKPDALQTIPGLRTAVDQACHALQRPPETLEHTIFIGATFGGRQASFGPMLLEEGLTGSPTQIAERLFSIARQGFSHIHIYLTPCTLAGLEAFAPVLEIVRREAPERAVLLKDAGKVESTGNREKRSFQ